MNNNVMGINDDRLDNLIMDIYNYAERIKNTLNQISDVVDQTKNCYDCNAAYNYRNKFNSFKTNFDIVNKNVVSYADDLIKLKNKYSNINTDLSQIVKLETVKVENNNYIGE